MVIRFKVPFDNGTVKCEAGETTSELSPSYAARLVRAGLAVAVPGNRGLNEARRNAGLAPVKKPRRRATKSKS